MLPTEENKKKNIVRSLGVCVKVWFPELIQMEAELKKGVVSQIWLGMSSQRSPAACAGQPLVLNW